MRKRSQSALAMGMLVVFMRLAVGEVSNADDHGQVFASRIAPVLVAKCVACHQAGNAKGGFDLTTREALLRGGDGGPGIVPGRPDESPIYSRAIPHGGQPPEMPEKGEPLTEQEAAVLREWIEQGAAWPEQLVLREKSRADASFWSLQPVQQITPPDVTDAPPDWSHHPIDRFIRAKLRDNGMQPNPPADPRTFIRRATFDLWGLPPSYEEVQAFERDCRESRTTPDDRLPAGAVERLIERLLQNPHYGERWGRHWLDIAHYADTHGFERDQMRPNAWRYRDYVIASLNADKPYDQFLREQIAGDVLDPDNPDAVVATGFLAAGPWDFVGQVETRSDVLKRAARASDLDDMLTQVMTATMGLTIHCARCHDHKLDPISQEEYYRLTAVFAGVRRGERDVSPAATREWSQKQQELTSRLKRVRREIAELMGEGWDLADLVGGGDGYGTGKQDLGIDLRSGKAITEKLGYHRDLPVNRPQQVTDPATVRDARPFVQSVFIPDGRGTVLIAEQREVRGIPATSGHAWDAIRNGRLNAQVSTQLHDVDYAGAEHSLLGLHANSAITFDLSRLQHAETASDFVFTGVLGFGSGPGGTGTLADFSVFVDQELRFQKRKMQKNETATIRLAIPAAAKTLTLIATDGGDGIGHDLLFLGDAQIRPDKPADHSAADRERLTELREQAEQLEKSIAELPAPARVYAIITETPPEVRVLHRGNPEDPGPVVAPGVLQCVSHAAPDFGDGTISEGGRRRRLAEWITHPGNPLTRRVLVNRLWHYHFGRGIVSTPSDFGYGGDRPSHPELLDWLAEEVLRSGWSLKSLHRTMMLSATYQQSSANVPERAQLDSDNRLLWRQNSRRLDAESLRDAVLCVSGNLNPAMGGPGYRDFRYTEAYAPIYEYVTPDSPELWRRSVYRFVVRTTPHQFMSTLDCPDPANLTPVRVTTTTALQALTLSNNEFMLRQSEYLARRAETEASEPDGRITRAFQLALQRNPTDRELHAARHLVEAQGMFALCRSLLNANEFVYLD